VKLGWNVENEQLIPIMSQMTAAPDSLIATAPMLARHSAAFAENMDYHAMLHVAVM